MKLLEQIGRYHPTMVPAFTKHFTECFGKEINFEDVTQSNLNDFVFYLSKNVARSSARTYCAVLKSILNKSNQSFAIPCKDYDKILSVKGEKSVKTYLSEAELKLLEDVSITSDTERVVKAKFLLGAYTGARFSDIEKMNEENIIKDLNILQYVSQKTHTPTQVPIKPIIPKLLKVLNDLNEVGVSLAWFNKIIRTLCERAGINQRIKVFIAGKEQDGAKFKYISSHTARRSFATNLYLRGTDIFDIGRMMGHNDFTVTPTYIAVSLRNLNETTLGYFK